MMKERPAMVVRRGVSVKDESVGLAARILVIEDNGSDVFLLRRALNRENLRFDLMHLPDGGTAIAFVRRQGTARPHWRLRSFYRTPDSGRSCCYFQ